MIPRGDLQATFVFKGFDEVQRLGLTHATEAAVRAASRHSARSGETPILAQQHMLITTRFCRSMIAGGTMGLCFQSPCSCLSFQMSCTQSVRAGKLLLSQGVE